MAVRFYKMEVVDNFFDKIIYYNLFGCDGQLHYCDKELHYLENRELKFVKEIDSLILGICDNSCKNKKTIGYRLS